MVKVIAQARGYFGGVIRDAGEPFNVPDDIWEDEKRRPKWAKEASGSVEATEVAETATDDDDADDAADKPKKGKGKGAVPKVGKGKSKPETVQAPEVQPFGEAPAPVRAKSEINDALGTTQPDWIAPGAPVAVTD